MRRGWQLRRVLVAAAATLCAAVAQGHPGGHHTAEGHAAAPVSALTALAAFRLSGDGLHLSRAMRLSEAALADYWADPATRYAAARVAQAAHQFDTALEHLRWVFAARPADGPAHALAAAIHTLRGEGDAALRHCRAGRLGALEQLGCSLRARQATPAPPTARERHRFEALLDRLTAVPDDALPSGVAVATELLAWLRATAGDLAATDGDWQVAHAQFRRAYALEPTTRHAAALAESLLQLGRPAAVLALLPPASPALALRVKRARAQLVVRQAGSGRELQRLRHDMAQLQRQGDLEHARELGEYLLFVAGDALAARDVLRQGLTRQREWADEQLFHQALRAAPEV